MIEADEVWEINGEVWFRQGKIITSVPQNQVMRVVKPKANAATPAAPSSSSPGTAPTTAHSNPKGKEAAPRTVTRIMLKNGSVIDADTAWEENDGMIGYLLGNMQAFIEPSAVSRMLRGVTPGEPPPAEINQPTLRFTTGNAGLDQLIVNSAARHEIDPLLIYLVMREESGFNYRAVSHVGARGLMQLMPATAQRLGVRNIHDPVENVEAGTRYLKNLITLFAGDVNLALAAYNAGEVAVLRYGRRIPPYQETQNYVRRINAAYRQATASGQTAR